MKWIGGWWIMTDKELSIGMKFEKIKDILNEFYERFDDIEGMCGEIETDLTKGAEKKMSKKERKAYMIAKATERFPSIIVHIKQFNEHIEGLKYLLQDTLDNIQNKIDLCEEIESLQDELDDKKQELNCDWSEAACCESWIAARVAFLYYFCLFNADRCRHEAVGAADPRVCHWFV